VGKLSREKGSRGERELAALLCAHLGDSTIQRNLSQCRDGGEDLGGSLTLGAFAIEVKRCEERCLAVWWAQACEQASGRIPVLAYRANRAPWRFVVPLGAIHSGFRPEDTEVTVTLSLEAFAAVVREAL
jgi:hypothetical protein